MAKGSSYRRRVDIYTRGMLRVHGKRVFGHLFMAAFEGGYLGDANRDHRFSIAEGRKLGIPIRIIANPMNIEIMSIIENEKKGSKSSITINELFEGYKKFVEIVGESPTRLECLKFIENYYEQGIS